MPPNDKEAFIRDHPGNLTTKKKNVRLSAKLVKAPFATMQIVRIERIEIGDKGWRIVYRPRS
jgi:hypothetical protein